jgi:hypothetical protein
MRTNMDPLTPTTSTLTPVISHIAETAATLSSSLHQQSPMPAEQSSSKEKQQKTVQWVLDAPARLAQYKADNKVDKSREEWQQISKLLDRWQGTRGVAELRARCEETMNASDHD